jgi:hypothetical protein
MIGYTIRGGTTHEWYRYDAATARCYHCTVETRPYLTNAAV